MVCSSLAAQPVEELVLTSNEVGDATGEIGTGTAQRVDVALPIGVVRAGQWCLRDQRPDAQIVGLVGDERELLVEHAQLVPGSS